MSDNEVDPSGSTQQFKAFAQGGQAELSSGMSTGTIAAIAVAVVVVIAVIAALALL